MIQPKDITTNQSFMGSVFRNAECEVILRNLILLQKDANPDRWTPFTWEQYKAFCSHGVTDGERGVLNALVNGGKSVPNTTTYQEPGWLEFDGTRYMFTEKMLGMIERDFAGKGTTHTILMP